MQPLPRQVMMVQVLPWRGLVLPVVRRVCIILGKATVATLDHDREVVERECHLIIIPLLEAEEEEEDDDHGVEHLIIPLLVVVDDRV